MSKQNELRSYPREAPYPVRLLNIKQRNMKLQKLQTVTKPRKDKAFKKGDKFVSVSYMLSPLPQRKQRQHLWDGYGMHVRYGQRAHAQMGLNPQPYMTNTTLPTNNLRLCSWKYSSSNVTLQTVSLLLIYLCMHSSI